MNKLTLKLTALAITVTAICLMVVPVARVVANGNHEDNRSESDNCDCTSLTANPTSGEAPLKVHFHATSVHNHKIDPEDPMMYFWEFGDGQIDKTISGDIDHTYTKAGDYKIKVRAGSLNSKLDKEDDACVTQVKVREPNKPQVLGKPTTLPNTGAGDVIGIFAATTVAGTVVHYVVNRRRAFEG